MNYLILLLAGVIPLAVGALYYSNMLFGKSWMNLNGFTEDQLKEGNPIVLFGSSYIFSCLLAFALSGIVIHQTGVMQLFAMDPGWGKEGSDIMNYYNDFMSSYGDWHRSFGHGALHGGFIAVIFALPLIAINALFERRGWKYIGIHFGYWFVTLILMGGVICQFM